MPNSGCGFLENCTLARMTKTWYIGYYRSVSRNQADRHSETVSGWINWCLSGRAPITCHCEPARRLQWQSPQMFCHCEPVRLSGVAIPRLEEKCIDNCPTEQGNAGIYGGNRHLAPFNRGIATTSLRTGLAMTGNLEPNPSSGIVPHRTSDVNRFT